MELMAETGMVGYLPRPAEPFVFSGAFAGDAEVHMFFMESAAAGRFFEFNPGETVSGETSPGYMLLGAALFHGLYGFRNILCELGPPAGLKKTISALLLVGGIGLFGLGTWAAIASFQLARSL